jgi:hypothetical protein
MASFLSLNNAGAFITFGAEHSKEVFELAKLDTLVLTVEAASLLSSVIWSGLLKRNPHSLTTNIFKLGRYIMSSNKTIVTCGEDLATTDKVKNFSCRLDPSVPDGECNYPLRGHGAAPTSPPGGVATHAAAYLCEECSARS